MKLDWQFVVIIICVVWATSVIVRRVFNQFNPTRSPGCASGGCGSCPAAASNSATDMVELQLPEIKKRG